jgi:HEAT repeat protein
VRYPGMPRRPSIKRLVRRRDVPALVEALSYTDLLPGTVGHAFDDGAQVRVQAIVALAELGAAEAVEEIAARLDDPEPAVRLTAVRAIYKLGAEGAVEALVAMVVSSPEERYAGARGEALGVLRQIDAPGLARRVADALAGAGDRAALDGISQAALVELARGEEDQLVETLVTRLRGVEEEERPLLEAMLVWLDEASVQPVIGTLRDPALCGSAANVLGTLKSAAAVPALADHVCHVEPEARRSVVWALGEIRDPRSVEALLRATADEEFPVRRQAQDALDRMGTVAIVAGMTATLRPLIAESARQGAESALGRAEPQVIAAAVAAKSNGRTNGGSERVWEPLVRRLVERSKRLAPAA